jgi:hypothetical protein
VTIDLFRSTGNLIGRVLKDADSTPISGASATLPALSRTAISDAGGAFSFLGIPAAFYQVDVSAVGFTPVTTFANVAGGQTASVAVRLRP